MAQETILVVDDSREFARTLTKYMLKPLDYEVLYAADGKKGLVTALAQEPDLIISDINMPHMTGMEMLRALHEADLQIPTIFMTMHGSESIAVEAFRMGVKDYLTKPFTPEELELVLDRALSETRLARQKEELSQNLLVSETIRQTVVTLSHYINNYLMVLNGSLGLLQEELSQQFPANASPLQSIAESQTSAAKITAVLRVLQRVTKVKQTTYHGEIKMIDIEAALAEELARQEKSK